MENRNQFEDVDKIQEYVLGGHGSITVVSKKTNNRYTFTFGQKEDSPVFVRVKFGPEYEDSRYIGCIRGDNPLLFRINKNIARDMPLATFRWLWRHISEPELLDYVEVWHEGKCGRCGRTLTVPSSIDAGIGPVCAGRI